MPAQGVRARAGSQVLVGDTVVWRNGDGTNHTVTANDGLFDSGYIAPGGTFAHTFTKAGVYPYHCTIHNFMRGRGRVVPVALSAPDQAVVSGGRVVLQGLAPDGTTQVVVAQSAARGVERTVTPLADGSFSVPVRVFAPVGVPRGRRGPVEPARAGCCRAARACPARRGCSRGRSGAGTRRRARGAATLRP